MKKQILLLIGLVLISITLYGQRDIGDIEIIPNIGYSNSFLNGDNINGLDLRNALQFGATGDYYFNDRWSFKSGFSYFGMGATIPNYELRLDYLNIPINANWHFGKTRKWNLNFGITPGFLLKGEINGENVKEFYKSFQLAISYGIGYKIKITDKFNFLIDGQGLFGITNIIDNSQNFTRLNAGSSINLGSIFTF